jgi:hypothetical protein
MADPLKDIFVGLPEDFYSGSFELLQRVNKTVIRNQPAEADYSTACGIFSAFYEINGFKPPNAISPRDSFMAAGGGRETPDDAIERARSSWRLQYEGYRQQILGNRQHAIKDAAKESLLAAATDSFGYAILTEQEKEAVQAHLEEVRAIIEKSELDDRKKNTLFDRLSELQREVNRNGTRTDRFFAFASDLGFASGQFAKNAKPLFKEVKDILTIVTKARARTENVKLPSNGQVLLLPEPDSQDGSVS